jgi:hypothetical protein
MANKGGSLNKCQTEQLSGQRSKYYRSIRLLGCYFPEWNKDFAEDGLCLNNLERLQMPGDSYASSTALQGHAVS